MKTVMACLFLALSCLVASGTCFAQNPQRDELVTIANPAGGTIPYILTTRGGTPEYGFILMPGGTGNLNPRMEDGKLTFSFAGNFLIRSRGRFAGSRFVAASTDQTSTPATILAIAQDLQRRYGPIPVYVVGTSRSTAATMAMAGPLDGQVAGFIHTSSMNAIASFDPRKYKSRYLIVYHRMDPCQVTKPSSAASSRSSYGTETIEIDGGASTGDSCGSSSHHGYNGVEAETVDKIKAWVVRGK